MPHRYNPFARSPRQPGARQAQPSAPTTGASLLPLTPDDFERAADTVEASAHELRAVAQAWRDTRAKTLRTGDQRAASLAVADLMQRASVAVGRVTGAIGQMARTAPPPEAAHSLAQALAAWRQRRSQGRKG